MGTPNHKIGLRNHARSPGSISNAEHHDASGAHKGIDGSPGSIGEVFADTNENAVSDYATLRVANTTGAWAYLWVGEAGSAPAAPAIGDSIGIAPNSSENIFVGCTDNPQGMAFKASAATLQVIIME